MVKVDHPDEVGADRLVNAVAARESYKGAMIVIDFGTATTSTSSTTTAITAVA